MDTLKQRFNNIKDEIVLSMFETYYNLLSEWNEKFNLTAITEKEEIYLKHFADSLAAEKYCKGTLLDIGAGAGFPSLPLKICNNSLKVTMADSLKKRITFLDEVINKLGLKEIRAVHIRAEEIKEREYYDTVVARAVAPLVTLAEYMLPFVRIGGNAIAYKSGNIEEELNEAVEAIKVLGGGKKVIEKIMLDEKTERSLIIIKKEKITPKKYPRMGNKPRFQPIKK